MGDILLPSEGAPEGFPFAEKIARLKAGLSEEDFRGLRGKHLRLDVDFRYFKKAIFLTATALKKIAPSLECSEALPSPPAAIPAQIGPIASTVVKLLIVRTNLPNKRMLLACAVDENPDRPKKTVRVRVRSTQGFRIRTTIEAQLVAGYQDLYDLVSRYPRKKSKL